MGAMFLLVHGGFHGAWCWQTVIERLHGRGHRAEAIDLPCPPNLHGDADGLMRHWASQVVERTYKHRDRVILVGHSRGGLIVSQAAELDPSRFSCLVYCAALLVNSRETVADARGRLGQIAATSLSFTHDPESGMVTADPITLGLAVYSHCSQSDREWAAARLRSEHATSFHISPRLSDVRYGNVPRAMVECTGDLILPIALQRAMRSSQPCSIVETLECDHAPYLSDPDGLVDALDRIATVIHSSS